MFMIWWIFGRHSNYGFVITKAIMISKIIPIGLLVPNPNVLKLSSKIYLAQIHLHTFPISEKNKTQNPVPIISIKGLPERAEEGFWHENGQKDNFWKIKNSAAWRSLSTTKIFSQGQKFLISHIPNFWTFLNYLSLLCITNWRFL